MQLTNGNGRLETALYRYLLRRSILLKQHFSSPSWDKDDNLITVTSPLQDLHIIIIAPSHHWHTILHKIIISSHQSHHCHTILPRILTSSSHHHHITVRSQSRCNISPPRRVTLTRYIPVLLSALSPHQLRGLTRCCSARR